MKNLLNNKKILITGGAGFIGSNLCHYFVQQNDVICLDNLSTGKLENIQELILNERFTFIAGDLRNIDVCMEATKGVDIILHQAALGSVPRSIKTPLDTNANNVTGFLNIIEAARINNVKRIVFATSSSVYGDHPALPKKEDVIGKPLSPYAVTKQVNELYANVYGQLFDMEIIGLRYFNVYGPKQDPNRAYAAVIPKFIAQMIDGIPVKVNGDGNQTRDFTYIEDVIQANELAASTMNREAFNNVFNISFGNSISLNNLIETMSNLLVAHDNSIPKARIEFGPKRIGDIEHSYASIEKAQAILGYTPNYPLIKGLDECLNYLSKHKNHSKDKVSN